MSKAELLAARLAKRGLKASHAEARIIGRMMYRLEAIYGNGIWSHFNKAWKAEAVI